MARLQESSGQMDSHMRDLAVTRKSLKDAEKSMVQLQVTFEELQSESRFLSEENARILQATESVARLQSLLEEADARIEELNRLKSQG